MQLREKKTWLDRSLLVSLKKKRNDMGWRGTDAWLPMSHSKVYNSEPVRRILLDQDCGEVCRWTIVAMTVTYTTWLSIRIVWSPSQHIPGHWLWHFVIFLQRYVPQSKRLHFKVHPTKSAHNHIVWLINTISVKIDHYDIDGPPCMKYTDTCTGWLALGLTWSVNILLQVITAVLG